MNADKLASTLKRELMRNKKKSAILGVMCLIACYFWVPLVWRWVVPSDSGSRPAVVAAEVDEDVAMVVQPTDSFSTRGARRREIPWQELLRLIQQDERMSSATLEAERNPFLAFSPSDIEPNIEEPVQLSTAFIPSGLANLAEGLELTGIVYGPRLRLATINGREYRENDRLEIIGAAPPASAAVSSGAVQPERGDSPPDGDVRDMALAEIAAQSVVDSTNGPSADELTVELSAIPPVAEPAAAIGAVVASIQPKSVEIRFSDGTTSLLTLAGATINQQDVIRLTRTKPRR